MDGWREDELQKLLSLAFTWQTKRSGSPLGLRNLPQEQNMDLITVLLWIVRV